MTAAIALFVSAMAWGVEPASATLPQFASQVPTLAPLLKEITPAVVNIAVRGRVKEENPLFQDPFFRQFFNLPRQVEKEVQATGSGVIVDSFRGYILTNNHVVDHAVAIEVTTKDNKRYSARLVGKDAETDIAVLQISAASNLKAITFGDSSKVQVGDFVLAIGNPFGLGQTVTSGIVSALGRNNLGIEGYEDFIQTDASINPGNSGGALVDLQGNLIGINTAILSPGGGNIGIGFAIPVNIARRVMGELIAHRQVQRGRIGVSLQDLTPEVATALHTTRESGAVIASVEAASPAAQAGIQTGDIVIDVDGEPVRSAAALHNRIGLTPPVCEWQRRLLPQAGSRARAPVARTARP
jgi:Do/DeqQ family serine protease